MTPPSSPSRFRRRARRHTTTSAVATLALVAAARLVLSPAAIVAAAVSAQSAAGSSRDAPIETAGGTSGSSHRGQYNNIDNDNGPSSKRRTTFRVFQTLPVEPSRMTPDELTRMHRTLRATREMVFAAATVPSSPPAGEDGGADDVELALDVYAPSERREYLVQHGNRCHPGGDGRRGGGSSSRGGGTSGGAGGGVGGGGGAPIVGNDDGLMNALNDRGDEDAGLQWYDVLSRYDSLMAASGSSDVPSKKRSVRATSEDSNDSSSGGTTSRKGGKGVIAANSAELERTAIELFKFCVLYNGDGHAYWGWEEQLLIPFRDVVDNVNVNYGVVATIDGHDVGGHRQQQTDNDRPQDRAYGSVAADVNAGVNAANNNSNGGGRYIHESFLSISPHAPATSELSSMIRLLLETSDEMLALGPLLLPRELHRLVVVARQRDGTYGEGTGGGMGGNTGKNTVSGGGVAVMAQPQGAEARDDNGGVGVTTGGIDNGAEENNAVAWKLLSNGCIPLADVDGNDDFAPRPGLAGLHRAVDAVAAAPSGSGGASSVPTDAARRTAARCPLSEGGYCCLAFPHDDDGGGDGAPIMALRHPVGGWPSGRPGRVDDRRMPYGLVVPTDGAGAATRGGKERSKSSTPLPLGLGGVPDADLPYVSTVRLVRNGTAATHAEGVASTGTNTNFPTHPADAPNFFDMLFESDCLPYRKECHRCLKDVANEAPSDDEDGKEYVQSNACSKCSLECPCYCDVLCKIRPPPKPIARYYSVRPPVRRKEPDRLVPKIVHQTWFEPVTREKYPNMSRLIESWKKSGWEYYFYDDETAGEFLGSHFPPEIREAYESITPGAFKADLFRYCVLLIRGGVYADMDVLLQTNLDDAVANDIGFMTPIDEPGIDVGHRSCLWNGLIASAPGHPFLARTIEIVVNNIRNRFTAVDYDDMLCPNPILSVSHTVDTLFTCGPCILGAGINNLLGRHMQTEFEIGDVDIWQNERQSQQQIKAGKNAPYKSGDASNAVAATTVRPEDPRLLIPGRTVILEQNKNDMGAHRFTWADRHLIIAATDMPDYDDRPPSKEHYSKTHEKAGVYGMRKLYTDTKRANEEIRITVEKL